ncbi:MAG: Rieske 2Fe-2S domain-containing protein [Actinomycetota bacterium]|nr:Rieske 2Fe-2S domain-containing protein [Actinomycetota bacterium]
MSERVADVRPALDQALELFWHPVATSQEVAAAAPHPLAVTLLGRQLAVASPGQGEPLAVVDRCPHRSTRLSVGWVEGSAIRCAYHGWKWEADGRCSEIPALPDGAIPGPACIETFDACVAYDLVWVRLDASARTALPAHPAFGDDLMRVVAGAPYTWPTSAARRVENFVDLAHFPWVHDGSLGRRDSPVPPVPEIRRERGELRFAYDPPDMAVDATALFGHSDYCMPMPLTVSIAFELDTGARRHLWMTASPIDARSCRTFWTVARDDDLDGDDAPHMAFQQLVLDQDQPVVCNQDPPELPLEAGAELSIRTDRVSVEYRRWLRHLVEAAADGPDAVRLALGLSTPQLNAVPEPAG